MTRCEFCTAPMVLGYHIDDLAQILFAFVLLGLIAGVAVRVAVELS